MAGHNKWSKIKHKKAVADAKKSREFSRLARLITATAREAGSADAPSVRAAIEKAREAHMPKENIERALARALSADAQALESVTYEAYGPGGVALIIDTLTDNRNRTVQEIKHILTKHGGSLGAPGSAQWAFTKTQEGWEPTTTVPLSPQDAERLKALLEALEEQDDVEAVFSNEASSEADA
ncbi:MAG: hypothetical protein KatS3mg099_258 [Candidatus Parcubacteria bacterium]|nr:MAG: hypothetical protein KatS3mg099_258 [Candidatus Parcubacteria bacterium]